MPGGRLARISELDGVRALSVGAVLALHGAYGNFPRGGYLGVDIFFVLSGYLITRLLIAESNATGTIGMREFYARRVFRILPPLLLCLAIAFPLRVDPLGGRLYVFASALGFFANFVPAEQLGNIGPLWSLAIEEQFYLVWPLLFLLTFRRAPWVTALIALIVIGAAVCTRALLLDTGWSPATIYSFTFARMDAIMCGCLLALAEPTLEGVMRDRRVVALTGFASFGLVLLCLLLADREAMIAHSWAFTFFAVLVAVFLLALPRMPARSPLRVLANHPVAQYLGRRSYGIYLYHYPIFKAAEALRVPGSLANFALVVIAEVAVTLIVAELSWRLIERPALAFKGRFSWRAAPPVSAPTQSHLPETLPNSLI